MNEDIIQTLVYVIIAGLGWVLRSLYTAHEALRQEVQDMKEELPEKYVKQDMLKNIVQELKEAIRESTLPVLNKLDKMEDRGRDLDTRIVRIETQNERKENG